MATNIAIQVRDGESIDQSLRRFSRKLQKRETLDEIKRRQYYEKPSDAKRRRRSEVLFLRKIENNPDFGRKKHRRRGPNKKPNKSKIEISDS